MLSFVSPVGLETRRLALRALRLADAASLFGTYTSDASVARYLPWRIHDAQDETEEMIRHAQKLAMTGTADLLVITLRNADDPIGLLNLSGGDHGISIGFGLARDHWAKGYGSELVSDVSAWLLDQPSIWRVWGYCDEENEASAHAMTKAGMQFEGTLRRFAIHPNVSPLPRTCRLYAAVRDMRSGCAVGS